MTAVKRHLLSVMICYPLHPNLDRPAVEFVSPRRKIIITNDWQVKKKKSVSKSPQLTFKFEIKIIK